MEHFASMKGFEINFWGLLKKETFTKRKMATIAEWKRINSNKLDRLLHDDTIKVLLILEDYTLRYQDVHLMC